MTHRISLAAAGALLASATTLAEAHDIARAAGAAAGMAANIYMHELGHAAVFQLQGAKRISIQVPGEPCRLICGSTHATFDRALSAGERRWGSTAGLLASNLASEVLSQHHSLARSGFGQGFVAMNHASNLWHVYSYYTRYVGVDGYRGNDIDQFEAAGGNPHLLSAALVGYSLYAVKRMRDRQIPLLFVKLRF